MLPDASIRPRTDTPPPPPPADAHPPSRWRPSAAGWVAGTGAFLLLAAMAVFIAVRWSAIPLGGKVAVVGGVTGAAILAGGGLRARLPVTSGILIHLGALLIPLDVAAFAARAGVDWPATAVAEGVVLLVAMPLLAAWTGSRWLRGAAVAGVPVLATGIGGLTAVAAPLIVASAAIGVAASASRGGRRGIPTGPAASRALALTAGILPLAATTLEPLGVPAVRAVLVSAGWHAVGPILQVVLATVVAAGAAGLLAQGTRRALDVQLTGLLALAAFAVAGVAGLAPGEDAAALAALAFLTVQLGALLVGTDEVFGDPTRRLARLAEVPAAVVSLGGALAVPIHLAWPGALGPEALPTWVLLTLGWVSAGGHRSPRELRVLPVLGGTAGMATVLAVATASPALVAAALLTVAAAVGQRVPAAVPVVLAAAAAGLATGSTWPVPLAIAAAVVTVLVVDGRRLGPVAGPALGALAAAEVLLGGRLVLGSATLGAVSLPRAAAVVLGIAVLGALAAAVGRRASAVAPSLADGLRAGAALAPLAVPLSAPLVAFAVALLAVVVLGLEGLASRSPWNLAHASVPVHLAVAALATHSGLGVARTGLVVLLSATVWLGAAALVPEPLRGAAVVGAIGAVASGLPAAAMDPGTRWLATMAVGAMLVALGVALQDLAVAHVGGVLTTLGAWGALLDARVTAGELYTAPLSAHLILAGAAVRRRAEVSSWIAYVPAVALTGGAALVERTTGGGGWHAVVAGLVGVTAVAVGGWARLAGPLVVGTTLLVAATAVEALTVIASVPTWAWLALGGTTLLALGSLLERADTSPAVAGRRLLRRFGDRFD